MRGDILPRFLILSILVHGAILVGFQCGGWIPSRRGASRGFDMARARTVLERMKNVAAQSNSSPGEKGEREPLPLQGPKVVVETNREGPHSGDSLAPHNLNEILDRPLAGMEIHADTPKTDSPQARSPGTQGSDLDRVWRESAQDLPVTGSAGRGGNGRSNDSVGGRGAIVTEGFAVGGNGEVARAQLESTLAKRLIQMQNCYQTALLENSSLSGKILLRWTISERGEVEEVLIEKSQLDNAELHSCLVQEIAKTQFPKPQGGSVIIRYPLNFTLKSY